MGKPSFADIIAQMEKVNIGTYVWEPDVAELGVDNADTPLRRILAKLET